MSGRPPEAAPERSSSETGETRELTLEGVLARLEPMRLDHVEGLLDAADEDRSTFAFTWVPSDRAAMTAYVERGIALRDAGEQVPFVTWSRREERIVGSTRFYDLTPWDWSFLSSNLATDQRHDRPDVASIGYTWLARSAQRSGINTEAKVLMMTYAFEQWGVRAVRLLTDARNERSRAAIARLGCTLDGVLRADRPAADGTVRDSAVFSMLANEWPAHKASLIARLAGRDLTPDRPEFTAFAPTKFYAWAVPLHLWVLEPPPSPRNRLTCAIRLIWAIPQLFVLLFLNIVAFFAVVAAWFVALFTGRLDGPLREFIAGVLRWNIRVEGYFYFLTDAYPAFSLDEEEQYAVRLAIPPPVELNRAAVLLRIFIAIPAGIVANVLGSGTLGRLDRELVHAAGHRHLAGPALRGDPGGRPLSGAVLRLLHHVDAGVPLGTDGGRYGGALGRRSQRGMVDPAQRRRTDRLDRDRRPRGDL